MFGNKYDGDILAKEFYKLMTLKKVASEGEVESQADDLAHSLADDLENYADETVVDPARFLDSLEEVPDLADKLDKDIESLDSYVDEEDSADSALYSDDLSYLADHRAEAVLNGLGKIAGSLKQRGEGFAADMVEATALSIKNDIIKEASRKLETLAILSKVATDISSKGDEFTADIVRATMEKIKTAKSKN